MGRPIWLARSLSSVAHNFLCRQTISLQSSSSNGVFFGEFSQIQRAFIHSSAAYWYGFRGRHTHFARCERLLSKRFIHATGACRSVERDYYEILGISKDSTQEEIRKAFHGLAKKYHPDANKNNPSAKRKFQEIRDAYETLRDSEKRAKYDNMRDSSGRAENAERSRGNWDHFKYAHRSQFSNSFHEIFSEIFENETQHVDYDIQVELALTFSEAAKGCTKQLSFDADVPCDSCDGRGHRLDAETYTCRTCRGTGRVTIPPFTTTCSSCKGVGRIIKENCMVCKGSGVRAGVMEVKVAIPAGMDSGDTIRVPKAGNSGGWGRPSGSLFIKLKVAEDPIFSRQGADLYVNTHISFTQAILGGNIEVPTLYGRMPLRIPKGVQHGQLALLRGKGLPKRGFLVDHGDQYVRFCIKFPSNVTERQRVILEEFEKEVIDENKTSLEGTWWQYWPSLASRPKFILELSILILIFIFLNKVL